MQNSSTLPSFFSLSPGNDAAALFIVVGNPHLQHLLAARDVEGFVDLKLHRQTVAVPAGAPLHEMPRLYSLMREVAAGARGEKERLVRANNRLKFNCGGNLLESTSQVNSSTTSAQPTEEAPIQRGQVLGFNPSLNVTRCCRVYGDGTFKLIPEWHSGLQCP